MSMDQSKWDKRDSEGRVCTVVWDRPASILFFYVFPYRYVLPYRQIQLGARSGETLSIFQTNRTGRRTSTVPARGSWKTGRASQQREDEAGRYNRT